MYAVRRQVTFSAAVPLGHQHTLCEHSAVYCLRNVVIIVVVGLVVAVVLIIFWTSCNNSAVVVPTQRSEIATLTRRVSKVAILPCIV